MALAEDQNNTGFEHLSRASILFVDDEQNILTSLRRLFRRHAREVHIAESGKQGLQLLKEKQIDLVVSDMRMPEMDGAEFLKRVAKTWPGIVRILLTGYSDMSSTVAAINEGSIYRYISKPWDDNDIVMNVEHALEFKFLEEDRNRLIELTERQNKELRFLNANLEKEVLKRTHELRNTLDELKDTNATMKKNYLGTVKILSSLIEMRESRNRGHAKRVAELCRQIGDLFELKPEHKQDLFIAAMIHNIGKIGLSDELLSKPLLELDNDEYSAFMKHCVIGEGTLMSLDSMSNVSKIIRTQFEKVDGKGYPDNLTSDEIPLGARILSVARDFDLLVNGNLDKKQHNESSAISILENFNGKKYDPDVLEKLCKIYGVRPGAGSVKAGPGVVKEVEEVSAEKTTHKKATQRVNRVLSNGLEPGMVLAYEVVTAEGMLLLSEGHVLTDAIIKKLVDYEARLGTEFEFHIKAE